MIAYGSIRIALGDRKIVCGDRKIACGDRKIACGDRKIACGDLVNVVVQEHQSLTAFVLLSLRLTSKLDGYALNDKTFATRRL